MVLALDHSHPMRYKGEIKGEDDRAARVESQAFEG
jgi:hypothetical protein